MSLRKRIKRALSKVEDSIKDIGRKIDDEVIEPVKENPAAAVGLGLMFVPGLQGIGASLGSALAPAAGAAVQAGIGNAIIQGALTEAQGGDFLKGAALSGVGSIAGGFVQPGLSEALGGGATGNIASNALIGGGMSELSGGDFTSGALISGIGAGINQARLAAADEYLNSLPGGQGEYTDIPADVSDFDVIGTPSPPSFSIPETSVTAPNIDSTLAMLNLAKVAVPYATTALLSKGAYDLATQDEQGNYNYPVVSVPTDWRSPEYNQTFTPSEAIDFGNVGMLAGTQFQPMNVSSLINTLNTQQPQFNQVVGNINDVPMSINDIIGNLGQPIQLFDMNQNIGELNNAPASLNSIIAGIQSQYG
ncbi:hypothetical protein UFOVP378_4 [uncultured Caudovirales phage]|uniref:Uncharacterized protein n=1 Tax=uncultured Caudovirales phage TaxID=2100421 RepID=A0A6J7WXB7_9CAUD|nr:hypothetical protein UFOVP378_4 [uncultured Caudovirales phage]